MRGHDRVPPGAGTVIGRRVTTALFPVGTAPRSRGRRGSHETDGAPRAGRKAQEAAVDQWGGPYGSIGGSAKGPSPGGVTR